MPLPDHHIAIVCNPQAGNGKALSIADQIISYLKQKTIAYSVFTAQWPQVWNKTTQVWIVGGDGTLNYFINQYPEIKLPMSIFKGGTGNDFQEMLYGKINIEQQIEKLLEGNVYSVDAGICNENFFLNGVGIGFDGAIVKSLISKKKNPGKASYLSSVFKRILFYKATEHFIKIDDYNIKGKLLMVNIANGKTEGGGFRVAPSADLEDGLLDINIVKDISTLKRLFYLPAIEKGKHLHLRLIEYHQARRVEIKTSTPVPAHADGEYFEADHFMMECLSKGFSFLR
jgi:YegS/Rv2252/BmrU family lipid kinase